MKRTLGGAGAMVLLTALSGCVTTEGGGSDMSPWGTHGSSCGAGGCGTGKPMTVAAMQGPWGQPVNMAMPYAANPSAPSGEAAARAMIATSVPLDLVQQAKFAPGSPGGVMQAGGACPQGMICPAGLQGQGAPGAVAAVGALTGPGMQAPSAAGRTEVRFACPTGMKIAWFVPNVNARPGFSPSYLEAPGRYNFLQGAIYRLKLSNFSARPEFAGMDLYPTLEVVPGNRKTDAFLAHSAVPVAFTDNDFEQVRSGNYLVKVIYLPDPQFQETAATGTGCEEIVSSPLEPGVDPMAEASRRGSILLVIRMGNIDLEAPNTPAMDAPSPYQQRQAAMPAVPGMMPGMPGSGMMPPPATMNNRGMPGMPGLPPETQSQPSIPSSLRPSSPGIAPPLPTGAPISKLPETSTGVQQTKYLGQSNDKKSSDGISLFGSRVDPNSAK